MKMTMMLTMAMVNTEMKITRWGVPRSVSVVYDDDDVDEDHVDEDDYDDYDDYDDDDGHGEYGNENNKMRCSAIGQC